jgi:hypothetical protein
VRKGEPVTDPPQGGGRVAASVWLGLGDGSHGEPPQFREL